MLKNAAVFCLLLFPIRLMSQTASFTYNSINNSYCSPDTIQFASTVTGSPVGYIWDFGNTGNSHIANPTAIYNKPGTYNVRLIAVYQQGTAEITKTVVINPTINPAFIPDKKDICLAWNY